MDPMRARLSGKRILFAGHEIGGQMQLMVEELRRRAYAARAAGFVANWTGSRNDINLDLNRVSGRLALQWRRLAFASYAVRNFDLFHFFWGQSLFGLDVVPHTDLPFLKLLGKKVFVHFRGLDIVDLAYFDYLRAVSVGKTIAVPPRSRPDQIRALSLWRRYADRMLVSEPDLLEIVPEAELVPQTIDTEYWSPAGNSAPRNGTIRIVHAPTMRRKKGTEFVIEAVERLKSTGLPVELVLVEGIQAGRVRELYENCDIGVDQVLYGWHGKFSVELMSMAKPVICYINPRFGCYRPDLPVVNAGPRELEQTLRELAANPDRRRRLGAAGRAYACKYHDIKVVIDQCLAIYEAAFQQPSPNQ
jgi:glycosyltransferase involved in cell wall biosynthesis